MLPHGRPWPCMVSGQSTGVHGTTKGHLYITPCLAELSDATQDDRFHPVFAGLLMTEYRIMWRLADAQMLRLSRSADNVFPPVACQMIAIGHPTV
ncbi:hypothetical protein J6590_007161 [Homalodisca vitripennis]|nr:hypothetical protein J6590_007161 [Homalodisca vitripennis]